MKDFEPMLAHRKTPDTSKLTYPLYASPKLDGIRCTVRSGKAISRTKKPIANDYIRGLLSNRKFEGFDGELIVGEPTAEDCYLKSDSGVMTIKGQPDFTFWVFDIVPAMLSLGFEHRLHELQSLSWPHGERLQLLPQTWIESPEELSLFESRTIDAGYEGVILRSINGVYKFGRSTLREEYLLKLKRFVDGECVIEGIEEEMHNTNAAEVNELGRTKRSKAQAGLVGKGTMGALLVRDTETGVRFKIGTGFTAAQRAQKWKVGSLHKYKHFPIGAKDRPRSPVYIGPRSKLDL